MQPMARVWQTRSPVLAGIGERGRCTLKARGQVSTCLLAGMLFAGAARPAGAATRYVDPAGGNVAPYTNWTTAAHSIPLALTVAEPDDLVLVANATFLLGATVHVSTRVTLRSFNGPDFTVLDGQNARTCVNLAASGAVLDGFKIRRGNSYGVLQSGGTTMRNCTVEDCGTPSGGGGVHVNGGLVEDCLIRNNRGRTGAGAYLVSATLRRCEVQGNAATDMGGGVYALFEARVENSRVHGNSAKTGAGVFVDSESTLRNLLVWSNNASVDGGGILKHPYGPPMLIENCTVVDNTAARTGGGIAGAALAYNTVCTHNAALAGPNWAPDATVGQVWHFSCSFPLPPGTDNTDAPPEYRDRTAYDYRPVPGSPCIDTGIFRDWMGSASDLLGAPRVGNGTVDRGCFEYAAGALDAGFVAEAAEGPLPFEAVFHASAAGTNLTGLTYAWDFDNDGIWDAEGPGLAHTSTLYTATGTHGVRLRVSNAAGEVAQRTRSACLRTAPAVIHVSPDGSEVHPYATWADAARHPATALGVAVDGCQVLVRSGTYNLTQTLGIHHAVQVLGEDSENPPALRGSLTRRLVHLVHPGAELRHLILERGGAAIGAGAAMALGGSVRDCLIRDCEGTNRGGGVYLFLGGVLEDCVLAGNSVYLGAEWPDNSASGGGAYAELSNTVTRCVFTNNIAANYGGGLHAEGGRTVVRNCAFVDNHAPYGGGGGGVSFGGGAARLADSVVRGNSTGQYGSGGGVHVRGDEYETGTTIERCTISGNTAASDGGGVNFDYGGCRLLDSALEGNSAGSAGGGLCAESQAVSNLVVNCLIVSNACASGGGGAYLSGVSLLNSSTVTGNSSDDEGGGVYVGNSAVRNSIVFGNTCPGATSNYYGEGVWSFSCAAPLPSVGAGNTDAAPLFAEKISGQPYHLSELSPCVDAGGEEGAPAHDLNGVHRPLDGDADGLRLPDMGCYERASTLVDLDDDGLSDGDEAYLYGCNPALSDTDDDGQQDGGEIIAGTDPTDRDSFFHMQQCALDEEGFGLEWTGRAGRLYTAWEALDLHSSWSPVEGRIDLPGMEGPMGCTIVAPPPSGAFYKISVRLEE